MTQVFTKDGVSFPATVLAAGPVTVTQVKDGGKDGYRAVQVGLGERKKVNKPLAGHFKKEKGSFAHVREFRIYDGKQDLSAYGVGSAIDASVFAAGDDVEVSGTSKGKGFQGVVKRHGFHGGPRTHGQKHSEREAGSIGGGGRAGGRVAKGMRMAGRMGSDRVTVKGLKILAVNKEGNEIVVSGAIPGRRGTLIEVRSVK